MGTTESDTMMVLLVEDEYMIATLVEAELREAGFGVIYVVNGAEAQTAMMSCPNWDALVLDINLPGRISGWDVARIARTHCPNVAVVYASGHGELEWLSQGVPDSVIITKPYAPRQVVAALRELIGTRSGNDSALNATPVTPNSYGG